MADKRQLEFFLLRYVPNVAREEFVNIGLVMTESGGDGGGFAGVHFTADWGRARCLDPNIDVEMLEALGREMERQLKDIRQRALLLHEMMDAYSNTLQLSPIRQCVAENPAEELKDLARKLVEMPTIWSPSKEIQPKKVGRKWIHAGMSEAFVAAGVWKFLVRDFPASKYTNPADDFVFDFAYPLGEKLKIFHAVSLAAVGPETRMFPLRVGKIAQKMKEKEVLPSFMAVVEDEFDEEDKAVKLVRAFMDDEDIQVARLKEMPTIADAVRRELRA
ncbi:MAG: DUF3037 domain-containing protein [Candidatus Sulfotelmatobacter sp.]|jgi:DUF3037 family protein